MKKKRRVNLCMATTMLILLLTAWLGGKAVKAYDRNTTCCVVPNFSWSVVQAGTEDMRLAVEPTPTPKPQTTEDELISFYSQKYGVDEQLVSCIVEKESSWNTHATGDSGRAKGLAQFWLATYQGFRRHMGLSQEDFREDKAESIKTLCWGLANGKASHWSAYFKCK